MTAQTTCPDRDRLASLINGGASQQEELQLATHLDTCPACQTTLESLASEQDLRDDVVRNLGRHGTVVGGGLNTEIQQAIDELHDDVSHRETRSFSIADEEPLTFLAPTDDPEHLGRLGSYEVIDEIGRGGMGIVLKARDPSLNRIVALKVLAPHQAWNVTARQRFVREARSAAAVNHRHVVTIHAVEENNALPFLVMEYYDGQSLEQHMQDGPLTVKEIVRIGIQTAAGLAAAHDCGLVHRDIKPANILLERDTDWVKITDFGLARTADDVQLTKSGILTGTPAYMAPEQATDAAIDHRADLFSLGSVLYSLCTNRPPFRGPSVLALINQLQTEAPIAIGQFNPMIPNWLIAVIEKLHAKNPNDRFQSADEVVRLLMQHYTEIQSAPAASEFGSSNMSPPRQPAALVTPPPISNFEKCPRDDESQFHWWNHLGVRIAMAAAIVLVCFASVVGLLNAGSSPTDPETEDAPPIVDNRPTIHAQDSQIPSPSRNDPRPDTQPFAVGSRKFATLQAAIGSAREGDVIMVYGNGPFVTPPIAVDNRRLEIIAAKGFTPVIQQSPGTNDFPLLHTNSPLTLKGLEFRRPPQNRPPNSRPQQFSSPADFLVVAFRTPLFVDNCRFVQNEGGCVWTEDATDCELQNCMFVCRDGVSVRWGAKENSQLLLKNCVHTVRNAVTCQSMSPILPAARLELSNNTIVAKNAISILVRMPPEVMRNGQDDHRRPMVIDAHHNVFDVRTAVMQIFQTPRDVSDFRPLPTGGLDWLHRVLNWYERSNAYSHTMRMLGIQIGQRQVHSTRAPNDLTQWIEFWRAEKSNSVQGDVRYAGDGVRGAILGDDARLSAADYRLHTESVGYAADADGNDFGAVLPFAPRK